MNFSSRRSFNEPSDSYTQMDALQLGKFLNSHLGPTLEKLGIWPTTRLTYGGQSTRVSAAEFVPKVMQLASKYMDLIAYHGYDCQYNCTDSRMKYDKIADLAKKYPSKELWMTEICYAYNGDDLRCKFAWLLDKCVDYPRNPALAPPLPRRDFADGVTWGHRIVREVQAGASGWIYWNLLLDTKGGPFNLSPKHQDGPRNYQHPVVIVEPDKGDFHLTGLYYFLGHFSKYVRNGHKRVGTLDSALQEEVSAVAFVNDGDFPPSYVIQLVNRGSSPQKVNLFMDDSFSQIEIPAYSITTATW